MKLAVLMLALLLDSCVVPTPGMIYFEACVSYGNRPSIKKTLPDGTVVEEEDVDSETALKTIIRGCRD